MTTPDLSGNARRKIGFEYISLNLEHANQGIMERAAQEKISFEFLKTHWIAVSTKCPEVYYKLDLLFDNSGFCTCPSFIYRQAKHSLPCKHLIALDRHTSKGAA